MNDDVKIDGSYYRDLIDKIKSLEKEVARLKEENLKLNEYKFMYEGLCK